jgi:hypothetical protein
MSEQKVVVAIKSSIGDPTFVQIQNQNITVDAAILKAIEALKAKGNAIKGNQLEELYKTHQIFNGNEIKKGDLLSSLKSEERSVNDQQVKVIELELIAPHSGGN